MSRKLAVGAVLAAMLLAIPAVQAAPPAAKSNAGTIVIVFKDGHRQTFNLSDIERVEFPVAALAADAPGPANTQIPPRGHFIGKWEVGDGSGGTFLITLKENGDAERTLHATRGHWAYVNGEAQITWNDGAMDAIRRIGSHYQKFAYSVGKTFADTPANVGTARLLTEKPI